MLLECNISVFAGQKQGFYNRLVLWMYEENFTLEFLSDSYIEESVD